jgi:hypothetical protein
MKHSRRSRSERRVEAEARQRERDKRSSADQLQRIEVRRGKSLRERVRLEGASHKANVVEMKRTLRKTYGFKSSDLKNMSGEELERTLLAAQSHA